VNPILRLRQRELLRLVAESNSTKQVAPRLGSSTKISNARCAWSAMPFVKA
jgi:DNA-binding CsgD family transcriptional regulator